ncbi:hypothetical protein ACFLZP_02070 [Patescibacteria group bacterium]
MKKIKNIAIVSALVLGGIFLAGKFGIRAVRADDNGFQSPMIRRLTERFNLNQNEVEEVFTQAREEHRAQRQNMAEDRLDQAVEDGVLSEEQKQALIAKREEMRSQREQHREEMRQWFADQGIDHDELMAKGGCLGGGSGRRGMKGW